jgi:D-glycero-D-manno-heptose 1,7-bisphosphate phosphatase
MQQAAFLDRDGTMIHDVGYLSRLEDLEWFPWTIDAIRALNRAGFLVCVTSNQGGVGLGYYPEDFVQRVHTEMSAALQASGARVDAWFYCPHHPDAVIPSLRSPCDCRKPGPGMIRQAQTRFQIDVPRSFVVGDKLADVGLAKSVGAKGVLVRTGYGDRIFSEMGGKVPDAAHVATDLMAAVSWILLESGHPKATS